MITSNVRDFLLNWDVGNLHARAIFDRLRMVTMHGNLLWYCLQVDFSCKLVEVKFFVFLYRILNLFQLVNTTFARKMLLKLQKLLKSRSVSLDINEYKYCFSLSIARNGFLVLTLDNM